MPSSAKDARAEPPEDAEDAEDAEDDSEKVSEGEVSPSSSVQAESSLDSPLTRRQQRAAVVVIVACMLIVLSDWGLRRLRRERHVDIERTVETQGVTLSIDLNQAAWPELTLLPEISETMARRIVAYREQHGRFGSVEELQQVSGIGPRTMEQVRPFLRPVTPASMAVSQH